MVHVSPPDVHGYCTLGTSIDAALTAVRTAKKVIAQVNPKMPRTQGDGHVHFTRFAAMVWEEADLPEVNYGAKVDAVAEQIGKNVASLIEDGSTLQMGIGAISSALVSYFHNLTAVPMTTIMAGCALSSLLVITIAAPSRRSDEL